MVLPFGLHNTAATANHLVAQCMIPFSMNNEFVGVIEQVTKSLHGLLAEELGSPSNSDSSRGSHHPSWECFMMGTPEGHVESIPAEEATPVGNLINKTEGGTVVPTSRRGGEAKSLKAGDRGRQNPACAGMHGGRSGDRIPRRRWAHAC